jgi:phosphoglucan,water dikinase
LTFKSWKQKLEVVSRLLTSDTEVQTEKLIISAAYLYFINSGKIQCAEDGQHFRPNHHAQLSLKLFTYL